MEKELSPDVFKKGFVVLGVLSAAGLLGYAFSYIIAMPKVSPDGFVPKTLESSTETPFEFGAILAIFVLLYAFAFLPVNIMFTVKKHSTSPYALVFACCLISVSSLIEIINNLPVLAVSIYPGELESVPSNILIHLQQVETIRYLVYDVVGFSLIYMAIFVYAVVYFQTHRWLSYMIIGSIALFIANVSCLWFASKAAVILMVLWLRYRLAKSSSPWLRSPASRR